MVDTSGGALPGATVSVKNTATGFEQVLTTDPQGRFRALLLPLGPYRVTVSLTGFTTLVREGLRLEVGQTISLPFQVPPRSPGTAGDWIDGAPPSPPTFGREGPIAIRLRDGSRGA